MIAPLLALALAAAPQQTTAPKQVIFACSCDGNLGGHLQSVIRDKFALSPRFKVAPSDARWKLSIITTVSSGSESDPTGIAISIVVTFDGFLMKHSLVACGRDRIDQCATDAMTALDQAVNSH